MAFSILAMAAEYGLVFLVQKFLSRTSQINFKITLLRQMNALDTLLRRVNLIRIVVRIRTRAENFPLTGLLVLIKSHQILLDRQPV